MLGFHLGLAYSRHMKTIRSHLNQLVLPVNSTIDNNSEVVQTELTKKMWASAFNSNRQVQFCNLHSIIMYLLEIIY